METVQYNAQLYRAYKIKQILVIVYHVCNIVDAGVKSGKYIYVNLCKSATYSGYI